ncbi:uncharacterized protein LOC129752302 [Uranotaenia lowii]|uniref:uncharacterized protein LOC129752302 n=1 Tax=Uranotaenia lowii TaxID=190385 RepID=UPI00247B130A|nr:uncharacterized protein LOC129752302 [Uranotaenia lowii]
MDVNSSPLPAANDALNTETNLSNLFWMSGRTNQGNLEVLFPDHQRPPVPASSRPVYRSGGQGEGFQLPFYGKYSPVFCFSPSHAPLHSSTQSYTSNQFYAADGLDIDSVPANLHRTSGRTSLSNLEVLFPGHQRPFVPAPSRPVHRSGGSGGDFQLPNYGKYPSDFNISPSHAALVPDDVLFSSVHRTQTSGSKSFDSISFYYQNVGGINSCLSDYLLATSCSCYDVIAFTETWLNDCTLSGQIFGPDYSVFCCDRSARNSKKSSGGGVLIAVKSNLSAQLIDDNSWCDLELVWTRIDLGDQKLYVCVLYLPPDRSRDVALAESFSRGISKVSSSCAPEDDILVIGDFNMPGLKWCSNHGSFLYPDPARSTFSTPSNIILDSLSTATLRQINSVVNENGRMLDLCFANDGSRIPTIELAPAPLVKAVPHHPALSASLEVTKLNARVVNLPAFYLDYKNANFEDISRILATIDWASELDLSDPNSAAETFSHILNYVIDRHVPKRTIRENLRTPWVTTELRRLETEKRCALRNYNEQKSPYTKYIYRKLNSAYKKASKRCYQNYLRRVQRNLKSCPKSFWKHVNSQRKEPGIPTHMFLDNITAKSDREICDLFAQKFSNIFTTASTSPERLASAIRNISPLGFSLNASLDRATFPLLWKEVYMFPVHKKGDRRDVNNYRGISALCSIAKLFELVVLDPISSFCKNYISNDQHGFMPKRSTTSNLLTFTSFVHESFAAKSQTDAIYTDLSAAFDKVNHEIAIGKLGRLGFGGTLLGWIRSYLTGRKLTVWTGDTFSKQFSASSGVPQGSHLGPIIFLMYFNDVLSLLDSPKLCYADDLKLFYTVNDYDDINFLQNQFNLFANWCDINCLPLNRNKCAVISFSRKRQPLIAEYYLGEQPIARVDHINDLDVILDKRLEFKTHTNYVVNKASRSLALFVPFLNTHLSSGAPTTRTALNVSRLSSGAFYDSPLE